MHFSDTNIASYPFVLQESMGGVSWPNFAAVNESMTVQTPNRRLRLGQYVVDRDGNFFQIVKAGAALTIGQVVTPLANTTGAVATAAGPADNIHIVKTNFSTLTLNSEVGNFAVFVISATSTIVKRIKANTASSGGVAYLTVSQKDTRYARGDYDADAFASAVANAVVVHIVRPWNVGVCGVNGWPVGVAQGTVTSGNYTAVQVHGHGLCASSATPTAVVDNAAVVPAALGAVAGATGTMTALEAFAAVGIGKIANANAAGAFSECFINLFGRW